MLTWRHTLETDPAWAAIVLWLDSAQFSICWWPPAVPAVSQEELMSTGEKNLCRVNICLNLIGTHIYPDHVISKQRRFLFKHWKLRQKVKPCLLTDATGLGFAGCPAGVTGLSQPHLQALPRRAWTGANMRMFENRAGLKSMVLPAISFENVLGKKVWPVWIICDTSPWIQTGNS